jgi:hypothetical protein
MVKKVLRPFNDRITPETAQAASPLVGVATKAANRNRKEIRP